MSREAIPAPLAPHPRTVVAVPRGIKFPISHVSMRTPRVRRHALLGVVVLLIMWAVPALSADVDSSSPSMMDAGMRALWLGHEEYIREGQKKWDRQGQFGRKSRNEATQENPQALFRWYEAMGAAARDEITQLNKLLVATESHRARARDGGKEDLDRFLAIVEDFDRWLILHFQGMAEDVHLVAKHKDISLRGCDFIAPDISAKEVDWEQFVDFYRRSLSPLLKGPTSTWKARATSSKYPNLLLSSEVFLDKVVGRLSEHDARLFSEGIRKGLACRYDSAYVNYALREWSQASGDEQLARLITRFTAWSTAHAYSPDRYLDGMLDAIRPQYVGVFWYRGGPLDRCDPRLVAWSEHLKAKTAYDRAIEAHVMFRDLDKQKVLIGGGGGATIRQCLDIGKAGCGLGSAILGSTLASSGMDGVCGVGLRGEDSAHGIVAVQTEKGLLFLDRATPLCALYDDYIRIRQEEARRTKQYKSFVVLERSFGSQARSLVLLLGPNKEKPVVYDKRPPYYRCQQDGMARRGPAPNRDSATAGGENAD